MKKILRGDCSDSVALGSGLGEKKWKMAWIITALAHSYVKCSWILIKLTVNKSCTALGNFGDIHPFTKVIPQNVTFMPSDFSVSSGLRATPWSRAMSRQWTKVFAHFHFLFWFLCKGGTMMTSWALAETLPTVSSIITVYIKVWPFWGRHKLSWKEKNISIYNYNKKL